MKVAVGTVEPYLERRHAAQGVGKRRVFEVRHAGVRNNHAVALEVALLLFEKIDQRLAADLLLALDDKRQVARQLGAGFEVCLDRLDVSEVLPLVVARAAGVQVASANLRIERRCGPQLQRIRRLHIVVAVDEKMRPAAGALARGGQRDDRVAVSLVYPGLQSDRFAVIGQPAGAGGHVFFVHTLRRDTWKTQILDQLVDEPLLVGLEVVGDLFHQIIPLACRPFLVFPSETKSGLTS